MSSNHPQTQPKKKTCIKIFEKGPRVTREILQKMQKERREVFGYKFQTRELWVLSGLILLFLLSLIGMTAMWFTSTFDNIVFSKVALSPDSDSFKMFLNPSPKPLLSMYIFNYTNVEEYENKEADKLHVQELGPYVYEVTVERVNPHFNGTSLSYQDSRSYKFKPELSQGHKQSDHVTVPNVPLLSAVYLNRYAPFLQRIGVSGLLNGLNSHPFITLPAHRFLFGYEDRLYKLAKSYMSFKNHKLVDAFGLLANANGVRNEVITVDTGIKDINKVLSVVDVDGESSLHQWSTAECNNFSTATDGSLYAPQLIRNKLPVKYYTKDLCRPLPLNFEKETTILNGKILAYRYVSPDNIYDRPEKTPSNQCFCDMDLGDCPLQGLFNATSCAYGSPVFLSFPHFYKADPILKQAITGLKDNPQYLSYSNIHPTLGYVMTGTTRVQVNVQVVKPFGITQINMFNEEIMLPVSWAEFSLDDKTLPEDMVGVIFLTSVTLNYVEAGLKYGFLLTVAVTFFAILIVLRNKWCERTSRVRPLRTNEGSA